MIQLQFAHISDTHITPDGKVHASERTSEGMRVIMDYINALPYNTIEAAEALVREINALPVPLDFVLHTGDVVWNATSPEDYRRAQAIFAQLRVPVYFLRGNVDLLPGVQQVLSGLPATTPKHDFSFVANGVRIACLDSNDDTQDDGSRLTDDQLAWLRDVGTQDDIPLVVALHHNPFPFGARLADEMTLANGEALHQLLRSMSNQLRGVFYGHIHQSMDVYRDGILYSSVLGALVQFNLWTGLETSGGVQRGALPGYSIVTLTEESTYIRRIPFRVNE